MSANSRSDGEGISEACKLGNKPTGRDQPQALACVTHTPTPWQHSLEGRTSATPRRSFPFTSTWSILGKPAQNSSTVTLHGSLPTQSSPSSLLPRSESTRLPCLPPHSQAVLQDGPCPEGHHGYCFPPHPREDVAGLIHTMSLLGSCVLLPTKGRKKGQG